MEGARLFASPSLSVRIDFSPERRRAGSSDDRTTMLPRPPRTVMCAFAGMVCDGRSIGNEYGSPQSPSSTPNSSPSTFLPSSQATIVAWEEGKKVLGDEFGVELGDWGEPYSFPIDLPSQTIPANAHITVRGGRGNIVVRSSDEPALRLSGEKSIRTLSEGDANNRAPSIGIGVSGSGDAYEIRPTGFDLGDSRVSMNMDVVVPKKATITVRTERGDITLSDMLIDVSVATRKGDVEVNDTTGNVSVDNNSGDVKVSDTEGDVKIPAHGGPIEAVNATGGLVVDGEFYGSIRADKITKGVRFISQHTDLTLTQLGGHLEKTSGNLEITDAPGNLAARTKNASVSLENVTGK